MFYFGKLKKHLKINVSEEYFHIFLQTYANMQDNQGNV